MMASMVRYIEEGNDKVRRLNESQD